MLVARWKGWVLLAVVGAHLLAVLALHEYRPIGAVPLKMQRAAPDPDEPVMVLFFPARPAPHEKAMPSAAMPTSALPRRAQARRGKPRDDAGLALQATPLTAAPLDLQLPPPASPAASANAFLEHKPALSYEGTRFERAWISEGNMTHVIARKSKIAGVLLSVVGALIVPCTESDLRNYKRGCAGEQYQHELPDPLD